ncbi:MAG: hypothetical protein EHM41_12415 [Chloroflexi bacterium]|nr:MAG: hypothetical protein EHM41_12415 [Chloroflexota bacterium]
MYIIDAHEDLAYCILTFGRDYTLSTAETRRLEAGTPIPERTGDTLLGYPDYVQGRVAVVFATLFAAPWEPRIVGWEKLVYRDIEEAHRLYWKQLEIYQRLTDEHPDLFRLVLNSKDLDETLQKWQDFDLLQAVETKVERDEEDQDTGEKEDITTKPSGPPVGLVVLMEGAEGVRNLGELEEWWQGGVRIIGPAWKGTRFCGGTDQPGPLTREGYALLEAMAAIGFGLDLAHMDETSAMQAIDAYPGTILASHANAKALLKEAETNRHLTDCVIQGLLERDGIIGVVPGNSFLKAGWRKEDGRGIVSLQDVVTQIDYICQMAGDALHVGIGTDFDAGFGWQKVPVEIDTIADLHKLGPLLAEKGYTQEDIAAILGGNWGAVLKRILPEVS